MKGSIIVFCSARPEAISNAVKEVLKGDTQLRMVSYVGPEHSPFAGTASRYYSWGKGSFDFWKFFRLFSRLNRKSENYVILPLNRDDGKGYCALRLLARYIGGQRAREVTLDGQVRLINMRRFLDTYRIEEILFKLLVHFFRFFKPFFAFWLKPLPGKPPCILYKVKDLPFTFLKDFEPDKIPVASIIIRTYNEELYLEKTLKMIFAQKSIPREVVVIDSGSTDATIKIAQKFPVRLVRIRNEYFGYGRALNLGARLARGYYVVNLSAHAIPIDEFWLAELINPLKDKKIAGVHGAERPMEGYCGLLERKILIDSFSDFSTERLDKNFFSNANSAMRRKLVLDHPFDESVDWAEDRLWAKRLQEFGYKIAYKPKAAVYHSHNLSARGNFERNFRFFAMQFRFFYRDRANDIREGYFTDLPSRVVALRRFLSDQKLTSFTHSLVYAPFCEFVNYLGCEFAWEEWNNIRLGKLITVSEPQNQVAV